ncbi:MAG: aminoacyl-tRNA hydrolase [Bacteriovoracaceae bacterium]
MMKLVAALGNPGVEYELTRHNIAWLLFDFFPSTENAGWKSKFKGQYVDAVINGEINGEKTYFLKPETYMNLSGESVGPMCSFFKIKPEEVLVVHDEVDLPFGQIHFKKGGGFAGHNGLKSIAQHLGTPDFYRMRLGIGRPDRGSMSNWVLGKFPKEQDTELGIVMENSSKALSFFLNEGLTKAATKYNKKNFLEMK